MYNLIRYKRREVRHGTTLLQEFPVIMLNFRAYQSRKKLGSTSAWKKKKTHYASLEVTPSSTSKEIKDAFIRLSKLHHPDVQKSSEDSTKQSTLQFQEIVEAYKVLGDPDSKNEYDLSLGLGRKVQSNNKRNIAEEYDAAGKNTWQSLRIDYVINYIV